jgi:hypothetical protein
MNIFSLYLLEPESEIGCGHKSIQPDMLATEGRIGPDVFTFKAQKQVFAEINIETCPGVQPEGDIAGTVKITRIAVHVQFGNICPDAE